MDEETPGFPGADVRDGAEIVPFEDGRAPHAASDTAPGLTVTSVASFAGREPPKQEWAVGGLIPKGFVTLLSGPGGTGKSLLGLMLQIAGATGRSFLGRETSAKTTLGFYGEEDGAELERRGLNICRGLNVDRSEPATAYVAPLHGQDAVLATWNGERMAVTPVYQAFEDVICAHRPEVVVLDNIARLFSGNENDRLQVTQFVTLLEAWAVGYGCAVLLLGHPSKAGAEYSGSTAWESSARSRLYFARPEIDPEADPELVADKRVLSVGKSNLGRMGDEILVTWKDGYFELDWSDAYDTLDPMGELQARARASAAEQTFLDCLDELRRENRSASDGKSSVNYAPKIMAGMPTAKGAQRSELERAMGRLFHAGKIRANEEIGRKPNRHPLVGIARVEWLEDGAQT